MRLRRGACFLNVSKPRTSLKKPDIDIDFDARFRDDIADYVYQRYGCRPLLLLSATFHTYHARSALRDLGKAFGYPLEEINRLTKNITHIPGRRYSGSIKSASRIKEPSSTSTKVAKRLLDYCAAVYRFSSPYRHPFRGVSNQ